MWLGNEISIGQVRGLRGDELYRPVELYPLLRDIYRKLWYITTGTITFKVVHIIGFVEYIPV